MTASAAGAAGRAGALALVLAWALVTVPFQAHAACASDLDQDGICDANDNDRDGDGVGNARDPRPNERDVTPPAVTFDGDYPRIVNSPLLVLEGNAMDPGTGLLPPMTLKSSRLPGTEWVVCPDNVGDFAFEPLQLLAGDNILTIVSVDRAGLRRTDTLTVTFSPPPIVLSIAAPSDGRRVHAGSIAVAGTVTADELAGHVKVSIGSLQQAAQALGNRQFSFSFPAVGLQPGLNRLVVTAATRVDRRSAAVDVYYDFSPPPTDTEPPVLEILSPAGARPLSEGAVTVVGSVADDRGLSSVTVQGVPALLYGPDPRRQHFERWVDLSEVPDGPLDIVVRALDAAGRATQETLRVLRDAHGPLLEIAEPPGIAGLVRSTGNPLTVRGTVRDTALAGLELDGRTLTLAPVGDGVFAFEAEVALAAGIDQAVRIEAWDSAGSSTVVSFLARLDAEAQLRVVEPVEEADLLLDTHNRTLPVVALAQDLPASATVQAHVGGRTVAMARDGAALTASLDASGLSGEQVLRLSAERDGSTIATTTRRFRLSDAAAVALQVVRFDPANGATAVESNAPIAVHLSKPVAPGSLSIELLETVHGEQYDLDRVGARVAVHRDQQRVDGRLSLLPDGLSATFYPSRELAYGGQIQVGVRHGDEEIGRAAFTLRPLPTLAYGGVTDQFGEPLSGIPVALPELGLTTTTNADGAFSFGFGDAAVGELPAGRHRLSVNPGLGNPRFGTRDVTVTIEAGALNRFDPVGVPLLNPLVPFLRVAGGQTAVELGGGGLVLDLHQAQLLFPDQRREGVVHVQFADLDQIGAASLAGAMPLWAFATQPPGVSVSGAVALRIVPPELYGSRSYLPEEGHLALLIGLDRSSQMLRPVGVARMSAGLLVSDGPLQLEVLDYVGVRLVDAPTQELLQRYLSGELSLAQLTRALEP